MLRSGQTRGRIPSNAWARKIAAPTKPITAVIVSNIANVPLRHCATENGGDLAQSKRFPGTNTQSDRSRIMGNRRASSCDPAPRIWDFAPRRIDAVQNLERCAAWGLAAPAGGEKKSCSACLAKEAKTLAHNHKTCHSLFF
jgi:hypothetical protein